MSGSGYQVYLSQTQTLGEIIGFLQTKLRKAKINAIGREALILFGNWKVRVIEAQEPWVAEEAKELAARCKDKAKSALLKVSTRRLEIELADDPSDSHYNNGLAAFEYLCAIPGAVGLDPVTGDFY
jgi:hypothetical protein